MREQKASISLHSLAGHVAYSTDSMKGEFELSFVRKPLSFSPLTRYLALIDSNTSSNQRNSLGESLTTRINPCLGRSNTLSVECSGGATLESAKFEFCSRSLSLNSVDPRRYINAVSLRE